METSRLKEIARDSLNLLSHFIMIGGVNDVPTQERINDMIKSYLKIADEEYDEIMSPFPPEEIIPEEEMNRLI